MNDHWLHCPRGLSSVPSCGFRVPCCELGLSRNLGARNRLTRAVLIAALTRNGNSRLGARPTALPSGPVRPSPAQSGPVKACPALSGFAQASCGSAWEFGACQASQGQSNSIRPVRLSQVTRSLAPRQMGQTNSIQSNRIQPDPRSSARSWTLSPIQSNAARLAFSARMPNVYQ